MVALYGLLLAKADPQARRLRNGAPFKDWAAPRSS